MRAANTLAATSISSDTIETGSLFDTLAFISSAKSGMYATLTTTVSIDAELGSMGGSVGKMGEMLATDTGRPSPEWETSYSLWRGT